MTKPLSELAQEAIDIQSACNPLGLSKRYVEVLTELRQALEDKGLSSGTEDICCHPVNRLWASKFHDLAQMGLSNVEQYGEAYKWCKKYAVTTRDYVDGRDQ